MPVYRSGVGSISKSGSAKLKNDVTLSEGTNITLTQSGQDIQIAGSASGAPADAHYVTTQAESGLSAESNLGALTSGLLKHTVSGSVSTPATAVADTDYASATHASRHQSGGADAIKLDDLAAPDDNTDLDVSITKHGLVPKAPNDAAKFLRGDGTWNTPAGAGDVSSNTSTSVDDELVLFSGTGGKTVKRATSTGILKAASGVIGVASAGTDYAAPGANTDITSVLLNQTGLVVKGGDANALTIKPNETLTGAKTLNLKVNDTSRTIDLSGNLTINGNTTISTAGAALIDDANAAAQLATLGLDADIATLSLPASTTISAFGATLVDDADAATALGTLGLDTDLATFSLPASTTISAFGASLIDDAANSNARTTLGLGTSAVIDTGTSGTKVALTDGANSWSSAQTFINSSGILIQDTDASHTLGIIGGSNLSANRTLTITPGDASRTLTISGNATVSQDYSTAGNPQFATIELGAASDTTLARSGAGDVTIEGNAIYRAGGTDVPVADGGTGASTLTGLVLGNGTSAMTAAALSGDVSSSGHTTTIGAGKITNAMLSTGAGELGAAWATFTPSRTNITIGNGTEVSKTITHGKLVVWHYDLTLGSTSSIGGDLKLTLPATSVAYGGAGAVNLGMANLFDSSAGRVYAANVQWNTTADVVIRPSASDLTYTYYVTGSSTVPFTWATSDEIGFTVPFEKA